MDGHHCREHDLSADSCHLCRDAEIARLSAENQKWREAFGDLEWDDMGDVRGRKECHACGAFEEDGHKDGCVFKEPP